MEKEGSLLCSQQPALGPYPEPDQSLQFYEGMKRFQHETCLSYVKSKSGYKKKKKKKNMYWP